MDASSWRRRRHETAPESRATAMLMIDPAVSTGDHPEGG